MNFEQVSSFFGSLLGQSQNSLRAIPGNFPDDIEFSVFQFRAFCPVSWVLSCFEDFGIFGMFNNNFEQIALMFMKRTGNIFEFYLHKKKKILMNKSRMFIRS